MPCVVSPYCTEQLPELRLQEPAEKLPVELLVEKTIVPVGEEPLTAAVHAA